MSDEISFSRKRQKSSIAIRREIKTCMLQNKQKIENHANDIITFCQPKKKTTTKNTSFID